MKIEKKDFENIRKWLYMNSRPLDFFRWKYHFENGKKTDVIQIMKEYQNEDGGFGHALEADTWNVNSSPYTTSIAIKLLEEIDFTDKEDDIIKNILKYLDSTLDCEHKTWSAIIPSNNNYPHASWWTYKEYDIMEFWGYTPTADLIAFAINYADKNSRLYSVAKKIALEAVELYLDGKSSNGALYKDKCREGEINCYVNLLKSLEKANLGSDYRTDELKLVLKEQVNKFIEYDSSKWKKYSRKPSLYIKSPQSIFYLGNENIINKELDFIISERNKDRVWDITWEWSDYHDEFQISRNWWKSNLIIENLILLKAFGR